MHHGESREVVGGRRGRARLHVRIHLRPAHTQHAADHPLQAVVNVVELRLRQRTLAIDHNERMQVGPLYAVIVVASVNRIEEALAGISGASSKEGVCNRAVIVVDDAHRRADCGWLNVSRHRDRTVWIEVDIRAVDVLGEFPAARDCDRSRRDRSPYAEDGGNKVVGGSVRQQRAEVALIGVISNPSLCPDQGLARDARFKVAGARNVLGAAGARQQGDKQDHRRRRSQPEENRARGKFHTFCNSRVFGSQLTAPYWLAGLPERNR